jgi:F0F1-type ATP synthase alpha subunit
MLIFVPAKKAEKESFDDVIRDYDDIIANKNPLPDGKFYRDLEEQEKKRLNKLLDMARIMQKAVVEKKPVEHEFIVDTLVQSMVLNRIAFAKVSDEENRQRRETTEEYLKKLEPIVSKEYVDFLRKKIESVEKAMPYDLWEKTGT